MRASVLPKRRGDKDVESCPFRRSTFAPNPDESASGETPSQSARKAGGFPPSAAGLTYDPPRRRPPLTSEHTSQVRIDHDSGHLMVSQFAETAGWPERGLAASRPHPPPPGGCQKSQEPPRLESPLSPLPELPLAWRRGWRYAHTRCGGIRLPFQASGNATDGATFTLSRTR